MDHKIGSIHIRVRTLPPQPELDLQPFSMGPENASLGCLLIHGFSGSPPEMRWLGEYLAARGVRVEGVRLAGHGTDPSELSDLTWQDWVTSVEQGLERIKREGRRVIAIGFSMGGLLALRLCVAHPEIERVVSISSPIHFRDPRIHLVPAVRHVVRWHRVRRPGDSTDPQAHMRYRSYRRYPLIAVDQLLDLVRTTRKVLPLIKTPALLMQGMRDTVVHPKSARYIYAHLGSDEKELVWWHNSGHGVVFDSEREAVWERIWTFVACAA